MLRQRWAQDLYSVCSKISKGKEIDYLNNNVLLSSIGVIVEIMGIQLIPLNRPGSAPVLRFFLRIYSMLRF
jgi:hypothetical protein